MRFQRVSSFLLLPLIWQPVVASAFGQQLAIPPCGTSNSRPFAPQGDGANRPCLANGQRHYVPRHKGIGFEILDSESQACFVTDQEYRLLDELIDIVLSQVKYDPTSTTPVDQARTISNAISRAMLDQGFALYIDTETLSDALFDRNAVGESPRRIFDCDTGSLIFLTVAQNLGTAVAMVEMPLPRSKNHHNFVRWLQGQTALFEWDMNLRSQCRTPPGLTGFEGKSMSHEETIGYALSLRSELWKRQQLYDRALADFHTSMILYAGDSVYNNLAWLIATREVTNRDLLKDEALVATKHAVENWPNANYKDTLACVYALRNDFRAATKTEIEALAENNDDPEYNRHLKLFQMTPPKDCTGQ